MYNNKKDKLEVFKFRRFGRKGYSLFACLGREVIIGTLSVATLSHAKAEGVSVEPLHEDSITTKTDKERELGAAEADRELMLEEISVTGSRVPMTIGQAPRMVTVLEKESIEAAPVQSINDLLKYAAGVDVRQKGALGALTDISIRGGTSDQITVLLNGINICDAQTGHNSFDFPLDISEIERIEVLEGPAGRVYGTSSLYGAINIVTKPCKQTSLSAHAEGGSYGYISAGARCNYSTPPNDVSLAHWNNQLSANIIRSDGYSRNSKGGLNADYKTGKAFYQGLYENPDITVNWHAGLSVKDFGSNTFYGTGSDDQFEHTFKTFTALQAENKKGIFHLKPSIYWNHQEDRFEYYRDDDAIEHNVAFNYHRADVFGVNLNSYFEWIGGRTALSAELRNEDLVSTTLGEELEEPKRVSGTDRYYTQGLNRTNISFTLEHNILLNGFTLSAGLVAVKNSWNNAPMKVYPGMDISYRIEHNTKVYLSFNSSLRMPSATELYYSVGGHKADKYLKPEELQAIEGGLKYSSKGFKISGSIYYNHCKNMIDWIYNTDDGDDAIWESVNFTTVNTIGFEAATAFELDKLIPSQKILKSFSLSYNYMHQDKDMPSNYQSKYSLEYLKNKLVADLQLKWGKDIGLGINYRFQDRTGTYSDTNGTVCSYEPYGIVDAKLMWNKNSFKLYLEANNLTNKTYVDYGNVPQPGFWFIAGVQIDLTL